MAMLGTISFSTVQYKLSKVTGSDEVIENLHWALFKRKGKVASCGQT